MGIYTSKQQEATELKYIHQPELGDVYEYKSGERLYSTYKIVRITNDSIYVLENDYETDKMTGITKIEKEENYTTPPFGISRQHINAMYEEGIIFDINR